MREAQEEEEGGDDEELPRVAGTAWAVWNTWGIATATRAAARSAALSSWRIRPAIRNTRTGISAASAGTTRSRDPASSSPPNTGPATTKNIPGKYGYVTPHPEYARETWPVSTSPCVIRKYSPMSLPKYTWPARGERRRTRERERTASRRAAVDFRIPRAMGGP